MISLPSLMFQLLPWLLKSSSFDIHYINLSISLFVVLLMFCLVMLLQLLPREKKRHEYHEAVKNRYKHLPEVKRIVRYKRTQK